MSFSIVPAPQPEVDPLLRRSKDGAYASSRAASSRQRLLNKLPQPVHQLLALFPSSTGRRFAQDVAAAWDLAGGPGEATVTALVGWLRGRRDVAVRSLRELRRRFDELVELRAADLDGEGVWRRRRRWGWR